MGLIEFIFFVVENFKRICVVIFILTCLYYSHKGYVYWYEATERQILLKAIEKTDVKFEKVDAALKELSSSVGEEFAKQKEHNVRSDAEIALERVWRTLEDVKLEANIQRQSIEWMKLILELQAVSDAIHAEDKRRSSAVVRKIKKQLSDVKFMQAVLLVTAEKADEKLEKAEINIAWIETQAVNYGTELLLLICVILITKKCTSDFQMNSEAWFLECGVLFLLSAVVFLHHMPFILFTVACVFFVLSLMFQCGIGVTWPTCWKRDNWHRCGYISNGSSGFHKTSVPVSQTYRIPPGLHNTQRENLSSFNCVLQILSRTPLVDYLDTFHMQNLDHESFQFVSETRNVLKNLANPDKNTFLLFLTKRCSVVNTLHLRKAASELCKVKNIVNFLQVRHRQDIGECLLWFIGLLHEVLRLQPPTGRFSEFSQPENPWCPIRSMLFKQLEGLRAFFNFPTIADLLSERHLCERQISLANSMDVGSYLRWVLRMASLDWLVYKEQNCSFIDDLFCGQKIAAVSCTGCRHMCVSTSVFNILLVPIPPGCKSVRVEECLAQLTVDEVVNECHRPSSLACHCQKFTFTSPMLQTHGSSTSVFPEIRRQSSVQQFPECVAVQLMRFGGDWLNCAKSRTRVQISVNSVDMSNLLIKGGEPQQVMYSLFGVCVHSSEMGVDSGHCFLYSKSDDGNWFLFDDQLVTGVNIVQELQKPEVEENISFLFYKKL